MDISAFKADPSKIEWVGDIPGMGDLRLKVRSSRCSAFRDASARLRRAVPRTSLNRDGTMPADLAEKISGEAMAELLEDWENLTSGGAAMPFNKAAAMDLLTKPEFSIFREAVAWAADFVASATAEQEAVTLGNSPAP